MNVRTVAFQSNVFILAFGLIALGIVSLADYFFQDTPSIYSISILPDSGLLAIGLGGMLFASAIGFKRLLYLLLALVTTLCIYTVLHNFLAGGSDQGRSLLTGFGRPRSALSALVMLAIVAIMLAYHKRFTTAVKLIAAALIAIGLLQGLADASGLFPVGLSGFKRSAEVLASLITVLTGLALFALVLLPRNSVLMLDKATLFVGLFSVLIAVGSWHAISKYEQKVMLRSSEVSLQLLENTFKRVLQFRVNMVQRLGERWEALGQLPGTALWDTDIRGYLRDYPHINYVTLLNEDELLYSAATNADANETVMRLQNSLDFQSAIDQTAKPDSPRVLLGRQLGADSQLVMPLNGLFEDQLLVLVAGVDLRAVIDEILGRSSSTGSVRAYRGTFQVYGPADEAMDDLTLIAQRSFSMAGAQWRFEQLGDRNTLGSDSSHLAAWILGFILLFGFLLMVSLRLGVLTRERNKDLLAASEKLQQSLTHQKSLRNANRMIMHHSLDLLCTFDADGRFTQVSESCKEILGYSSEELIGTRFSDYVLPDDLPDTERLNHSLHTGGIAYDYLNCYVRKDGSPVYLKWSAVWSEEQSQTFCVARNITDQREVEATLERHRMLFEIAGQIARVGGWLFDVNSGELLLSEEVCAIQGIAYGTAKTLDKWGELFESSDRELLEQAFQQCLKTGEAFELKARALTLNSEPLWLRISGRGLCGDDGNLRHIQGALQDISSEVSAVASIDKLAKQMQDTLQSITDAFYTLDSQWRFVYVNPQAERLLHRSAHELVGANIWELFPEAKESVVYKNYLEAIRTNEVRNFELYYPPFDSWSEITAYPADDGLTVYFRDIGQRKVAEQERQQTLFELESSNRELRLLSRALECSINGVLIASVSEPDMPIIYANRAVEKITGYPLDEVIGRDCRFFQGEDTSQEQVTQIRLAIADRREVRVELRNYRKDGSLFWNQLYIAPVPDEKGQVTHFIGVQSDVTEQKRYEQELAHNASHDSLTGLPNRTIFEDRLYQSRELCLRHGYRMGVFFVDLDDFKPINDSLGHMVGDEVLIQVARRLESSVRTSDTVARMGGDEFIILLPDLARDEDAALVAENILQQLAKPYDVEGNRLQLTASIGITLSDGAIADPLQLIQQADLAMYRAKQSGRNDYQWYTENLNQNLFDRLQLRADLQRAIENSEFELYYQPQVQASALQLSGMEALLRWRHPERGMVPPDEFIPLAESTGQIVVLSEWVLATACQDAQRLQLGSRTERTVAVNVSPLHFQKSGFVKTVQRILTETGLAPRLLELEVTEGLLLENTEQAIDTLAELRALGISIAIDDFGTGYSSLSYLKRLPVDKIKIDKGFIRDLMSDTRDAAIVNSIIAMAHNLGMDVVAEGVETEAQHQFLLEQGCDSFQGFFFARPMPFEHFTTWLNEQL